MKKISVNHTIRNNDLTDTSEYLITRDMHYKFGQEILDNKLLPVIKTKHTGGTTPDPLEFTDIDTTTLSIRGFVMTEEEFANLVSILGKLKEFMSDEDEVEVGRILFNRWKNKK